MVSRRAQPGGMEFRGRWFLPSGDCEGRKDVHMGSTGANGSEGGIVGIEKGSDQAATVVTHFCLSSFVHWSVQVEALNKAADFVFEVPAGSNMWASAMHEPLLISFLFPFVRIRPWQLQGTHKMYAFGKKATASYVSRSRNGRNKQSSARILVMLCQPCIFI